MSNIGRRVEICLDSNIGRRVEICLNREFAFGTVVDTVPGSTNLRVFVDSLKRAVNVSSWDLSFRTEDGYRTKSWCKRIAAQTRHH